MKVKYLFLFLVFLILVVGATYLLTINLGSGVTGNTIVVEDQVKELDNVQEEKIISKDCILLDSGKRLCKLGQTKIKAGTSKDKEFKVK